MKRVMRLQQDVSSKLIENNIPENSQERVKLRNPYEERLRVLVENVISGKAQNIIWIFGVTDAEEMLQNVVYAVNDAMYIGETYNSELDVYSSIAELLRKYMSEIMDIFDIQSEATEVVNSLDNIIMQPYNYTNQYTNFSRLSDLAMVKDRDKDLLQVMSNVVQITKKVLGKKSFILCIELSNVDNGVLMELQKLCSTDVIIIIYTSMTECIDKLRSECMDVNNYVEVSWRENF